jgi:hypothetical protein
MLINGKNLESLTQQGIVFPAWRQRCRQLYLFIELYLKWKIEERFIGGLKGSEFGLASRTMILQEDRPHLFSDAKLLPWNLMC